MQELTATKTIKEPGYVYIYLSNEGNVQQDIYFDDLKITHEKTRVIQMDDYYPFGLTFNSSRRENSVTNAHQYNGKEMQDELGLGMLDYGARMYMSDIGRWGVVDPLAEKARRWSPYTYVYDNPLRFIDPDGMEGMGISLTTGGATGEGNAIEHRRWMDVSDPAKRAVNAINEERKMKGYAPHRLATCSTCPADSKYDQFRESDMPFAYQEGVGVYNDFEITVTGSRGDVQEDESLGLPFGLYAEGNARVSYGSQATIVPTPDGLRPLPYLRGSVGVDVNLGSAILWEGTINSRDRIFQSVRPFKQGVQGIEFSFFWWSVGTERIVSNSSQTTSFSFTFLNIGLEKNSSGENFIGFMPKYKWAIGLGAEVFGKIGWKF